MKVLLAQSCLTLCDIMDCSLPGSSIHGIFQATVLKLVAISCSRGSSWPREWSRSPTVQADSFPSESPGMLATRFSVQNVFTVTEVCYFPLSWHHNKQQSQNKLTSIPPLQSSWVNANSWSKSPSLSPKSLQIQFSSVQFSHSVVSDSLRPHESQHARPPCPSPAPRVHTFQPGRLMFCCHMFLPFHTVPGVLQARILEWFAIPSSSGPCVVRTLHYDSYDPPILGDPIWNGS